MRQLTLPLALPAPPPPSLSLNPERARWRRWAARAAHQWAAHGRWLPHVPREPCWEPRPPQPDVHAERDLVRPYVTAYLSEEPPRWT
ncbi:hypothetical protein ACWD4G_42385 [Streptomyces sp. NPDC002643]